MASTKSFWDASPKEAGNTLDDRAKWVLCPDPEVGRRSREQTGSAPDGTGPRRGKLLIVVTVKEGRTGRF